MRWVVALLLAAAALGQDALSPSILARDGESVLWGFGEERVLVARGAPRAMGLAHGRLLREEVRANVRAVLGWALGPRGRTREELSAIWDRIAPHIPRRYHEEMAGLAEGSGVPLADLQVLHAVPERDHCTGAAALPSATADGKVYHSRSLDYALDIGIQAHAMVLLAVPDEGIPHAIVGWAGFLGAVTGMNLEGVSIGEMGSRSDDEGYDGFPMAFLVREALRSAKTLGQAHDLWRRGPRTCGFNFLVCDREGISAVECNRSRVRFFGPADDGAEGQAPHDAIDGVLRRCNHFVDPALAATQRDPYDPRASAPDSWAAYRAQGDFLRERRGSIDAAAMIALLRGYPPTHPCLHQAVMCPSDLRIWVSRARDPAKDPLPGAQNQPFVELDLRSLLGPEPAPARVHGANRPAPEGEERGRVDGERAIEGFFAHEPAAFEWRMRALRSLGPVSIHHVTYPSPGPSLAPENETVHAEYFRPPGDGPFPAAIALDILDGRAYVARLLATALAQKGVAALYVKLPYYGERRPKGPVDLARLDLPDVVEAVRQGVRDIRRGAAWLRARPEVDPERVGIAGVSLGSFLAQLAAGADGGFDRCAFVLGGGSVVEAVYSGSRDTRGLETILLARGWTRERTAAALAPIEPLAVTAGLDGSRILMINCRADEVVPPASTVRYWEAIGKPEIHWYDGGHYGLKSHVLDVLSKITGHFAR